MVLEKRPRMGPFLMGHILKRGLGLTDEVVRDIIRMEK